MFLLTSTGTFTSSQYESIIESTKMAIDGLLNVFSALMPVYAILGAAMFGIAFVLLLVHIIERGGDMSLATKPIYEDETYEDFSKRVNRPYYNPSTGICEPMPPDMAHDLFETGSSKNKARAMKEKEDYYNTHDMFGNPI